MTINSQTWFQAASDMHYEMFAHQPVLDAHTIMQAFNGLGLLALAERFARPVPDQRYDALLDAQRQLLRALSYLQGIKPYSEYVRTFDAMNLLLDAVLYLDGALRAETLGVTDWT